MWPASRAWSCNPSQPILPLEGLLELERSSPHDSWCRAGPGPKYEALSRRLARPLNVSAEDDSGMHRVGFPEDSRTPIAWWGRKRSVARSVC